MNFPYADQEEACDNQYGDLHTCPPVGVGEGRAIIPGPGTLKCVLQCYIVDLIKINVGFLTSVPASLPPSHPLLLLLSAVRIPRTTET